MDTGLGVAGDDNAGGDIGAGVLCAVDDLRDFLFDCDVAGDDPLMNRRGRDGLERKRAGLPRDQFRQESGQRQVERICENRSPAQDVGRDRGGASFDRLEQKRLVRAFLDFAHDRHEFVAGVDAAADVAQLAAVVEEGEKVPERGFCRHSDS